jgi:hypothetical protein
MSTLSRLEQSVKKFLGSWQAGAFLLTASIAACVWFFVSTPAPGYAVAVLGAVAGIMTLREMKSLEKVVWIFALSALLFVELKAIRLDRAQSQREQKELRAREAERLQGIADGITTAINNSKAQFDSTMAHAKALAKATLDNANLARRGLDMITGGDSFPFVVPQTHEGVVPIPLAVHNGGKQILTGVTISVINQRDWGNSVAFYTQPDLTVGVLHPDEIRLIKLFIDPHPDQATGIDSYNVFLSAQNMSVWQMLQFRRTDKGSWECQYWVTTMVPLTKPMKQVPKGAMMSKVLLMQLWPDGTPGQPAAKSKQ